MKQIDGNFLVYFTTKDADKLPKEREMKNDLNEMFARVLDSYLHSKSIEGNEVHFITCDDFSIETED